MPGRALSSPPYRQKAYPCRRGAAQGCALEVCITLEGVAVDVGFRILNHHGAVCLIQIGEGKGLLWQVVEKGLLGVEVVLKSLVEVEVVTREIGEDTPAEVRPRAAPRSG